MRNLLFLITGILLFLTNCAPVEKPMTPEEKAEIETTITELFDSITQDLLSLNYERLFSYYNFDENLSFIIDGVITVGGDTIRKMFDTNTGYIKEFITYEADDLKIIVFDRDLVLTMGPFEETYITTSDDTMHVKGTTSYLLQLVEDSWKITHGTGVHKIDK